MSQTEEYLGVRRDICESTNQNQPRSLKIKSWCSCLIPAIHPSAWTQRALRTYLLTERISVFPRENWQLPQQDGDTKITAQNSCLSLHTFSFYMGIRAWHNEIELQFLIYIREREYKRDFSQVRQPTLELFWGGESREAGTYIDDVLFLHTMILPQPCQQLLLMFYSL